MEVERAAAEKGVKRQSEADDDLRKRRERSRSRARKVSGSERAKEMIRKSDIFSGKGDWFSCLHSECDEAFPSFKEFMCHVGTAHPDFEVGRVNCALKWCSVSCNNPAEWASHLASRHPTFVLEHDVQFFSTYFLKDR